MANGTAGKTSGSLHSSEAGYGYIASKARFRKTGRVEDMVNKICARKKMN